MATRFHEPVRRRVPVPLTDADDARLAAVREDPAIRRVLGALSDAPLDAPGASPTEAAMLHAILEAGWRALDRELQTSAYAQWGEERQAAHDSQRASARRRAPSWAAEQ